MTERMLNLVKNLSKEDRIELHKSLLKFGIERQVDIEDDMSKYMGFRTPKTANVEIFGQLSGDFKFGSIRFKNLAGNTVNYVFPIFVEPSDPKQLAHHFLIHNNNKLGRHLFYDIPNIALSHFGNSIALKLSKDSDSEE